MTEASEASAVTADAPPAVPASTYQLLRDRLHAIAGRLQAVADEVNLTRASVFASVPLALVEQDRLRTEQPSQPRDVVGLGDLLLFGFNTSGSLGRTRTVHDAFSLFRVQRASATDWNFSELPADDPASFLSDAGFTRDVAELFTYYADTRLLKLQVVGTRLLMVFSVGTSVDDVRVLRWQLGADDAAPTYIDAYGDHDMVATSAFDFEWVAAARELIVEGRWRHYAIANLLYIGIEKQQLEFRIDDVIVGGRTVHAEPLSEEQAIDELNIGYAALGDV
ncbi:MAG: DNA repair ATPase, partial [Actinomycetota bacterium]|nr:DNA repair ATPase [Actinomycetota bacterium]